MSRRGKNPSKEVERQAERERVREARRRVRLQRAAAPREERVVDRTSSSYERGYRDGYLEGLSECGPIAGIAQFFERRGKTKKLSRMRDQERQALIAEALAEYERPAESARLQLLDSNPSEAASAAIGSAAGGILLGPVGAAAGGYTGIKIKQHADAEKRKKRKKNPKKPSKKKASNVRSLVARALK